MAAAPTARWPRPKRFDRDLVVIGAGAAGLVTAYIAAAAKAKVTLVERHKMGGDCLNYGCVPSKALLRSAKLARQMRDAASYGLGKARVEIEFAQVMERVQRVIRTIEPHDSAERFIRVGVDVVQGNARLTSPWTVEITTGGGSQTLATRSIVIATGSAPMVPPIPGLGDIGCLTSETVWSLRELPDRLLVLGGGPVGCELAQAFARLGAAVTLIESDERLLSREDGDAAAVVTQALQADGVVVFTGHEAVRCERDGAVKRLVAKNGGHERAIEFDALLCAAGRVPRTQGFGLEELGIETSERKTLATNAALQTRYPHILACGDVAGPYLLTHVAAHQAWYAALNALFGSFKRFDVDYSVVPWTTFTDPELAHAGLSEDEAKRKGVAYETTRYNLDELDRAIADEAARGFVKVLTVPGKDRILGVTIVGEHAGEMIAEYVLAMKHHIGLNRIVSTIHTYPTFAEANRSVAVEWKLAHAPQRLLAWLERWHAWRRGVSR